jgi:CHASE1-domain containing sensor protein
MHKDQYSLVFNRRLAFDQRVWQIPSLAIAAHAFILSSALNVRTGPAFAAILSTMSVVLSLATIQLMLKLRQIELEDAVRLRRFEASEKGYEVLHGRIPPVQGVPRRWWIRLPSFYVWQFVLALFFLMGVAVSAMTVPALWAGQTHVTPPRDTAS